jgi:hypothetical protein
MTAPPEISARLSRIILRQKDERGSRTEEISITASGDLRIEGYDIGTGPKEFWGRDEYEFWQTVDGGWKDTLLLELLAERFKSVSEITNWLDEKGIPHRFNSWVGGD